MRDVLDLAVLVGKFGQELGVFAHRVLDRYSSRWARERRNRDAWVRAELGDMLDTLDREGDAIPDGVHAVVVRFVFTQGWDDGDVEADVIAVRPTPLAVADRWSEGLFEVLDEYEAAQNLSYSYWEARGIADFEAPTPANHDRYIRAMAEWHEGMARKLALLDLPALPPA